MNQYTWNLTGLAKGIDPTIAAQELERIENVYGNITAETILQASMPEDAVFHKLFEWNDSAAAFQYRLSQARNIINNIRVTVITDGSPKHVSAYEIIKTEQARSYKLITSMASDEIAQVKARTVRELNSVKEKLTVYKKFDQALIHIDAAIEKIDDTELG